MRSWTARYDGPARGVELNPLLALDGAGLPIVTVTSQGTVTDFDFATFKHDLTGARLWVSRFNSASNQADYVTALFTDAAGNVYLAGHSLGGEQPALSVVKYDAVGQFQWFAATTEHPWRTDFPCVITADSAGNAYVADSADGYAQVFKYDGSGNQVWSERLDGSGEDQPRAIAVDASGNLSVALREMHSDDPDFVLVRLSPGGQRLWEARYDSYESGEYADTPDTLFTMSLDAVGNAYLAGHVFDPVAGAASTLGVVKFDSAGQRIWAARHRLPRYTTPVAFAVNSSGASWLAYLATAPHSKAQGNEGDDEPSDAFNAVVHFALDGQERWVSVPIRADFGSLHGLAADNAGNAYLAGTMFREGAGTDLSTSRMDANGNLLWTALYNGPANSGDTGSAIAASPAGDIFVAGTSVNEFATAGVVLLRYRDNSAPGLPAITAPPARVLLLSDTHCWRCGLMGSEMAGAWIAKTGSRVHRKERCEIRRADLRACMEIPH